MMNYSIKIRFGTIVDMEKLLCMRKQVKLCGDSGEEAATARGLRRAHRVTGKTNIRSQHGDFRNKNSALYCTKSLLL